MIKTKHRSFECVQCMWSLNTDISFFSHISEDKAGVSAPCRTRSAQQLQLFCHFIHRRSREDIRDGRAGRRQSGSLLWCSPAELHEPPATTKQIRLQEVLREKGVTRDFCGPQQAEINSDCHVQDTQVTSFLKKLADIYRSDNENHFFWMFTSSCCKFCDVHSFDFISFPDHTVRDKGTVHPENGFLTLFLSYNEGGYFCPAP